MYFGLRWLFWLLVVFQVILFDLLLWVTFILCILLLLCKEPRAKKVAVLLGQQLLKLPCKAVAAK